VGIKGESDRDDVGRSVGAHCRESRQMPLTQEAEFGVGEVGSRACHDREIIEVEQAS